MTQQAVFTNAQIVTPTEVFSGSIVLEDGRITDVQHGTSDAPGALNCEGDFLIPGLIDLHTDHVEPMAKPRKSVDWPLQHALLAHDAHLASSGITTVFDSMYVGHDGPGEGSRSIRALKSIMHFLSSPWANKVFRTEHFVHLRAEITMQDLPQTFEQVFPHPLVRLVSLMDHTPGQRQYRDLEKYRLMEKKDYHHTDEQIDKFLLEVKERQELYAVSNRKMLIERTSGHSIALASHDDTTVEHVDEAHAEGITISEFPTTMEAAKTARAHGMKIVAGSPNLLLGGSHSGNVSVADLAANGILDVLASDYVPYSLLQGAFLLHSRVGLPMHEAIATISLNPAQITGLEDRGIIEQGKRADLVRVKIVDETAIPVMVWRQGQRIA